jgi:chromosome segregation ATPase
VRYLRSELSSDQARVRKNIDLLRKVRGNARLRNSLMRSLASLEKKLSGLTAKLVKLDEEAARIRGTLQALIGQIKLDATKL